MNGAGMSFPTRPTTARPNPLPEPDPVVSTLSLWAFDAPDTAAAALRLIERSQRRGVLIVADSAVVEWHPGSHRPVAYQSGAADGASGLSGAFWGLLFGSLFLAPLVGLTGPIWPPDGLSRIGLPESLLEQIRTMSRPGTSELFVLSPSPQNTSLRLALSSVQSRCLTTDLTSEQHTALHRAFGQEDDGEPGH